MLIPVLSKVSIAKDASTITLKDGTGAYNVSTNAGGYGTPNADEPTVVGLRFRYWPDTDPYGHVVSDSNTLIAALLGSSGYAFTPADVGVTADGFSSGVHHAKYYPLEEVDTIVTLTKDSTLVTVTAGTTVDTYNAAYKGLMFWNGTTLGAKVFLIDFTKAITDTTFYLTEAWTEDTVTGMEVMRGTEADLKILVVEPANGCVVSRIGKLGDGCTCNNAETMKLMNMVMQIFAAQVNFNCYNYHDAHNKVVGVDILCNDCKTTCSCS